MASSCAILGEPMRKPNKTRARLLTSESISNVEAGAWLHRVQDNRAVLGISDELADADFAAQKHMFAQTVIASDFEIDPPHPPLASYRAFPLARESAAETPK